MNCITMDGYRRTTERTAANRYAEGETIRITACKMSPTNVYGCYSDMQKDNFTEVSCDGFHTTVARNRDFETVIHAFEYYNCSGETGRYAAFYIRTV